MEARLHDKNVSRSFFLWLFTVGPVKRESVIISNLIFFSKRLDKIEMVTLDYVISVRLFICRDEHMTVPSFTFSSILLIFHFSSILRYMPLRALV